MSLSVSLEHTLRTFSLDVQFDVPGGITCLFGRSGSGKTTIVNAVAGLLAPHAGRISVDGWTIYDSARGVSLPPHKRRVGYIFQEARLFPHLSVAQNLRYGSWFAPQKMQPDETEEIIGMLGLHPLLTRRPTHLSGGEKQRVAIGRALLSRPRLILADEPLAALDDARKNEILPYFEKLRDHVKVPILYVSHSAAEVSRLATTVVALEEGQVIKHGQAATVLSDPRVTPLGAGAAGAFLNARVTRHHGDGITEVDASGTALLLPTADQPVGAPVRVRIEAQDVMIALSAPDKISALNVLPAEVADLRIGSGPGALVQLKVGQNLLLARITRRSAEALDLKVGKPVFAVLKAVSIPRGAIGDSGSQ